MIFTVKLTLFYPLVSTRLLGSERSCSVGHNFHSSSKGADGEPGQFALQKQRESLLSSAQTVVSRTHALVWV